MFRWLMQLLVLALLLLAVPAVAGGLAETAEGKGRGLLFRWLSGQFFLWTGFQLLCVPLILRRGSLSSLVWLFLGYMAALLLLAVRKERREKRGEPSPGGEHRLRKERLSLRKKGVADFCRERLAGLCREGLRRMPREELLLWGAFWGILLFQLVQAVRLVYVDSDDAYYVAAASVAESSDTMYQIHPYTGEGTELDGRHALAPFPIWIAFLARLSGVRTVAVAHTVLPAVLIAMSYGIYGLIAGELFPKRDGRRPLFLIFMEILVLFGNVSIYTVENFMIARSRQGKAALGNIVIPFLLFLLMILLKKVQERERIPVLYYVLLASAVTVACLCSTLGALLVCMAVGAAGGLAAVYYRRPGLLLSLVACCVPGMAYAFLYLYLS